MILDQAIQILKLEAALDNVSLMIQAVTILFVFGFATTLLADQVAMSNDSSTSSVAMTSVEEQKIECTDLKPGQSRVIAEENFTAPRHTPRLYRMARDKGNPKQYDIDLNYVFDPKEKNQEYLSKTKKCFEDYGKLLKDDTGTQLKFNFFSDPSNHEVPLKTVKILGPFGEKAWPMDYQWPEDLECPLIIHEVLHVTGLVDEYKVSECSNVGPRDSIMNSGNYALAPRVDYVACVCDSDSCTNQPYQVVPNSTELTCPNGWKVDQIGKEASTNVPYLKNKDKRRYDSNRGTLIKTSPSKDQPVNALKTAQIFMITHPRCVHGNPYLLCAGNAYMKKEDGECPPSPPECKKNDW